MDNQEKIEGIVNAFGALSELWIVVYRNFCQAGMESDEALVHTSAFMDCVFRNVGNTNLGGN